MVEAETAKAAALVQGWHDQQLAAVRRVEKATEELRAAVRDLREVGKGWDVEQRQAENRLAGVGPTDAVPPTLDTTAQPELLDTAVSIRTLAEQLGTWSIGRV